MKRGSGVDQRDYPEYVYRAISPSDIDPVTGEVEPRAFFLRRGEESLSVFSADYLTPRRVLQQIIDGRLAELARRTGKEREKYQKWIDRQGDRVEGLIGAGWQVARMRMSAFNQTEFQIGETESNGHISIVGEAASFEAYALDWVQWGAVELVLIE